MTEIEKLDYTLKALYSQTRNGTMLRIIQGFTENGQVLTIEELKSIKTTIEEHGYAVFQIEPRGVDYRGQITDSGIKFVENSSFSQPGISILNL